MEPLTESLLEFGAMGMFAAFLVWQYLNMQKRFDSLIDRFQEQIEKLRVDQKSEIDDIRDRYDKVITTYNEERLQVRTDLSDQMSQVATQMGTMANNMQTLPFDNIQIQIEALALNQRNAQLILERISEYMKSIEEEKKLQAMVARKLAKKDE